MFRFLSKTLFHVKHMVAASSQSQRLKLLIVFQQTPSSIRSLRLFATTSNQKSFTFSYLVNKCGLSPESASHAAKSLKIEAPADNADSVVAFFKDHGFSNTQIAIILKRRPRLLLSDVDIFLRKVVFLYSKGFSRSDLTTVLSKYPTILAISLENQITPSFDILRDLLKSDENVIKAIKLFPRILSYDFDAYILPNIKFMRSSGVPEYNIFKALHWLPKTFFRSPDQFKENVEKVKEIGFNPENVTFFIAVHALGSMSKSTLEKKIGAYKKYGLSEEEVFAAFRRNPQMIVNSEDKIIAVMDFLVNKLSLEASVVAKNSRILTSSLEKKIVPRGLFAKDLLAKGLLKKFCRFSVLFVSSEKAFLDRFVYRYQENASELLKLYEEKVKLVGKAKMQI